MGSCLSNQSTYSNEEETYFNYQMEIIRKQEKQQKNVVNNNATKQKRVNEALQKWQVDMYKNNSYLQKIPREQIIKKRKELMRRM